MNPITAQIQPYLLWIKLGLFALFVGLVFWGGWSVCDWRWESKENREKQELLDKIAQQQKDWEAERQKWDLASQMTATQIQNLETQKDTLMVTLQGLKLTRTITVKPDAQGNCVAAVLDDSFRLRWNTVVEATATNTATDSRE